MRPELVRRALAELVGTGLLVAAVIGSGIAATRLSPGQSGLQLLVNSVATGAVLVALVLSLQSVSAAFNPVVTLADRVLGRIDTRDAVVLVGAQVLGGVLGAALANLMFGLDPVTVAGTERAGGGVLLGEVVATFGLVVVVLGAVLGGHRDRVALAAGGYIAAAYWFTSSTSFANPAVTLARTLSDTFAGIAPSSAPMFVLMQVVGALLGAVTVRVLHPGTAVDEATAQQPEARVAP